MKLKEKKYTFHLDITKSLIDYDGAKLKKVGSSVVQQGETHVQCRRNKSITVSRVLL